jgi:hypothetical protein
MTRGVRLDYSGVADSPFPDGATQLVGSSGVVAGAGSAVATLTSATGRTAYLTGFSVSALGATTAIVAAVTITGTLGGTINFGYPVPAGVGVAGPPMSISFAPPLQASGPNTNIVVTVATLGAGNTAVAAMAQGYMI